MTKYWKVLNDDGTPHWGGRGQWYLPEGGRPGEWMPKIETLVPCESGYHLCRREDLVLWIGPVIFEAEARGDVVDAEGKVVSHEARLIRRLVTWDERTARLFACDCAERVVHHASDERSVNAIAVARRYANGDASRDELAAAWAAARAAARDAAWAAAWAAARDAERAWQTARLFEYLYPEETAR